ncbi:MAG: PIN domain-containing protein [Candidatus Sumerlaeota bacterium]|nr:PIN domain-containing protein [Candidatus Sumerlaeota bacterium]
MRSLFRMAARGQCSIAMHKINLLEAYYGAWNLEDRAKADELLRVVSSLSIEIRDSLIDSVFHEAARLKTSHKLSLADAIALAEAKTHDAKIVTSDHHEMDEIERREKIGFYWIR